MRGARDLFARLRGRGSVPPATALAIAARDRRSGIGADPGRDGVMAECAGWLTLAQDNSSSTDGGVARHYSLISGWGPSYPETTGYIIPTLLAYSALSGRRELLDRARRMLDWLASIQLSEGAFQGGVIGASPRAPVVFNTGQILLGLAAGERAFGGYRDALRRAADWLVEVQDADGCWRRYGSPFAPPGEKAYDTHVAWGLIEAERVHPGAGYGEAALANIRWALTRQRANGWFEDCCLSDVRRPITHTLGYALRGVIEGYRYGGDGSLLAAAQRTADGLLSALRPDGWLPGRLDASWRAAADWVCLTGSSQIAHCWLQLYKITGAPTYRTAAKLTNAWVRRTVAVDGAAPEQRGGVKGSFPFDGGYGSYEFLNWAAKFTIDANMLEHELEI